MSSSGRKPGEGTEELGMATADNEQGRGKQESVGELFKGVGPTGTAVRGRDMGGDATNRAGTKHIHTWGRETDHRETAVERTGLEIVLPLPIGGHG